MNVLDFSIHLLGFIAPAIGVALPVALAGRIVAPAGSKALSWWVQSAVNSLAGVLVLAAGLWYFGVDGKMATYAAMVVAVASCQWFCSRAWRT